MSTITKNGADITIGDMIPGVGEGFLIIGFEPYERAGGSTGRLAVNPWGEGRIIYDRSRVQVLNLAGAA